MRRTCAQVCKLTASDRAALGTITDQCTELAATRTLVRDFADMPSCVVLSLAARWLTAAF